MWRWYVLAILIARSAAGAELDATREAIRAHAYERAEADLGQPRTAEEWYLRALARYQLGRMADAVADARQAVATEEAPWARRARFLVAQGATALKDHSVAARLYEEEAARLLSTERKAEIAAVYTGIAEELSALPVPDELAAPAPDYAKAGLFYERALELEPGRELGLELRFRRARMAHLAGDLDRAAELYRALLGEHDAAWRAAEGLGPVADGTLALPVERGALVRFYLAEVELARGRGREARVIAAQVMASGGAELAAQAQLLGMRSYGMPGPPDADSWRSGTRAAREFLERHPAHPAAVQVAYDLAAAAGHAGRAEDAIAALEAFLAGTGFSPSDALPERPASLLLALSAPADRPRSALALYEELRPEAQFALGQRQLSRKDYDRAGAAFAEYAARYPNGPRWTDAQQGILDAKYLQGLDLVAEEKYDQARAVWDRFLADHPLDTRARRIMYVYGRIAYQAAADAAAAGRDATGLWEEAVRQWQQLVTKYPQSEEASLAQWEIGLVLEEKLRRLKEALEAYRALTWGEYAGRAAARVAEMTAKSLVVSTPRVYRDGEPAGVLVRARNIERVTVKVYRVNLEEYFRKVHGIRDIETLDIPLIDPDAQWEAELEGYAAYLPLERTLELRESGPGVWAVNVSTKELEATTLVIRSNLDVIFKASRRQVLVYAQEMVTRAPVAGATVLVSDGAALFLEGTTNEDGVFLAGADQLDQASEPRVFARSGEHTASTLVGMQGLGRSAGLSPRGFIYTDRPVYLPGTAARIKGILRAVKEGRYAVEEGALYQLSVIGPDGRLLTTQETELSRFGTFVAEVAIPEQAPSGEYSIQATAKNRPTFTGAFRVDRYQLEKVRLELELDRTVYFPGDDIRLVFRAATYDGRPVAASPLRCALPDGREVVGETDAEGRFETTFETGSRPPGAALEFRGTLDAEGVSVSRRIELASQGFSLALESRRPVVVVGEAAEVLVRAADPEGKPVQEEVAVVLLRRERRRTSPVLAALPWAAREEQEWAEAEVERKTARTGEEGAVRVSFVPQRGGEHRVRVEGQDRRGQPVSATWGFFVSDDEDATRLRLFADGHALKVGEAASVKALWREASGPALLTFEGETILGYRVVTLASGTTPVEFTPEHQHAPNFTLGMAVMEGRKLHEATLPFTVERVLTVRVEPEQVAFAPGAVGLVRITAADQIGRPVEAELSIALVQEALFDLFGDPTPDIKGFFDAGIVREAALRTAATNGFAYDGVTRAVTAELEEEVRRLAELKVAAEAAGGAMHFGYAAVGQKAEVNALFDAAGDMLAPTAAAPMAPPAPAARPASRARGVLMRGGRAALSSASVMSEEAPAPEAGPRREIPGAGAWVARVVTDAEGKAVVNLPMPEETTLWRIVARGCTVETLVGQATAKVETRREVFVELERPAIAGEGDVLRLPAVLHNLGAAPLAARIQLRVLSGSDELARAVEAVTAPARGMVRVVLAPFTVPAAARLTLELRAVADEGERILDALSVEVPVRAWGLELADVKGGSAADSRTVTVELDPAATGPRRMEIEIGARARTSLIEAALGRPRPCAVGLRVGPGGPSRAANELLASASALAYTVRARAAVVDVEALRARSRALAAALAALQREDGLWNWFGPASSDAVSAEVSARALWALAVAREQGVQVDPQVIERARAALDERFRGASADQRDLKATLLWALAVSGVSDFAHANRLYRERGELSPVGLAYAILTLDRLGRQEMGAEMAALLMQRIPAGSGPAALPELARRPDALWWCAGPAEAAALAALALEAVDPDHPGLPGLIESLELDGGAALPETHGPRLAALAGYYAGAEAVEADFVLAVAVNGRTIAERRVTGGTVPERLEIGPELLRAGRNDVTFEYDGRGTYSYTVALLGWSRQFPDARPWGDPYPHARTYYHAPLRYRGRAMSSSGQVVGQIKVGEVARVAVEITNDSEWRPFVLREAIPAGCRFVPDSIEGAPYDHLEVRDGELILTFRPYKTIRGFSYQIVGAVPGSYRVAPTLLHDALDPAALACGKESDLVVLGPGEEPSYTYVMNCGELWAFAEATFQDNLFADSLGYLRRLAEACPQGYVPEKERLLVWILSRPELYDADGLVDAFEVLKEKQPDLWIPFEKILAVGRAYRDKGEQERAALVYRATIEASFYRDARVGGVLETEGRFLTSLEYMDRLLSEYPDLAPVVDAEFALAQLVYERADNPESLREEARRRARGEPFTEPTRTGLLEETVRRLRGFRLLHPASPLCDDAAFSEANALLALHRDEEMVRLVELARRIYPADANFAASFPYLAALGLFHGRQYDAAIQAASEVAASENENRDLAVYILGQIHHARGEGASAVEHYRRVAGLYPDASGALEYFERKALALPEVTTVRPGAPVTLKLESRNLTAAHLLVYRVDLMTLYLREKNLARVAEVNLAGIAPQVRQDVELAAAVDYADRTTEVPLPLDAEGAYLVLARGGDLFASGLVLVTPLRLEVQEDAAAGRVRVNVRDGDQFVEGAHVKVVGAADGEFRSGDTDLRGIVVADGVRGAATVIARDKERRYAFYRGEQWLGPPAEAPALAAVAEGEAAVSWDLAENLGKQVIAQQRFFRGRQEALYSNEFQGVQVQAAY